MNGMLKAHAVRDCIVMIWFAVLVVGSFIPSSLFAQAGQGQVGLAIGTMGPRAALQDLEGNDAVSYTHLRAHET